MTKKQPIPIEAQLAGLKEQVRQLSNTVVRLNTIVTQLQAHAQWTEGVFNAIDANVVTYAALEQMAKGNETSDATH